MWPLDLSHAAPLGSYPRFEPWQILTYAFLHGGVLHLVLNFYALWLFGVPLERRWGSVRFAAFYFTCIVGAALMHLIVAELALRGGAGAYPVVGASGGIFGLLLAFGLLYLDRQLLLLFPPIPVKARWFVIGYGVVELVAGSRARPMAWRISLTLAVCSQDTCYCAALTGCASLRIASGVMQCTLMAAGTPPLRVFIQPLARIAHGESGNRPRSGA